MTEEKQGAAEWLREKARSIRRAEGFGCMQFMASEFGESCEGVRCADCYADLFERIAGRIDAEMVEYERLKKENAELKAELADWKGNAEGFQPDAYMKLPVDADGVPVCIGDKVNVDGDAMTVLGYRLYNGTLLLVVRKGDSNLTYTPKPSEIRHFKPVQPDSWEKLEADANKTVCGYVDAPLDEDGLTTCEGCRFEHLGECHQEMARDVLKRAKKLAGIDGGLRGSCGERVKRPAPEVLDADGVPIEVGDTVWAVYGERRKHVVKAVCSDGSLHQNMRSDGCCMVDYEEGGWDFADRVSHEPDSWRLWGEDLDMAVKVGEVDEAEMMRRAKALAKAGEGL